MIKTELKLMSFLVYESNEKKIIMRIIIIFFFAFNFSKAQPIRTPAASVKEIYLAKKQIYFKETHAQLYNSVSKSQKEIIDQKNKYISTLKIRVNTYTLFLNKKDTMQVKLIFEKYSPIAPVFLKMHFMKGSFIIDMNECVKEKGFTIKKFPCDCMAYRKEEEEK